MIVPITTPGSAPAIQKEDIMDLLEIKANSISFWRYFLKKRQLIASERLIWFFWGQCRYISHSWTDSRFRYFQNI